jgi:hypothetical protein
MKKLLSIIIVIALASTTFHSCKKGENDPLLSIKSRDARIVGTWKLTSSDYKHVSTGVYSGTSISTTNTSTFDGTLMTDLHGNNTSTYAYSEEITIEKDGTYSYKIVEDGDTNEGTSYWYWLDSKKNKIYHSYFGYLDKLSSKEIITIDNDEDKDTYSDGDSDYDTYESTKTYEKQ